MELTTEILIKALEIVLSQGSEGQHTAGAEAYMDVLVGFMEDEEESDLDEATQALIDYHEANDEQ